MPNKQAQIESFAIIGLGQTGLSCVRFLVEKGYSVAVMDTRENPPGLETLQQEFPEVLVNTGGLLTDWMLKSDNIVLSPGVDPRIPEVKAAKQQGINIIGDIELFTQYVSQPVIAITGSNGKSTVTTMLAEMAVSAGKNIQVGGNLGMPALTLITEPAPDFYILELSSFQLETVSSLDAHTAVVLNISPDHLDRYDDEHQYQSVKAKVYSGSGTMIINKDEPRSKDWLMGDRKQIGFTLSEPNTNDFGVVTHDGQDWLAHGDQILLPTSELHLTGEHNVANALAALALGHSMKLPMTTMIEAVKNYRGLPHRCQQVDTSDGIRWIDDSKATSVGACIAAIKGLNAAGKIILIAGGVAKEQDFSALTVVLKKHVKAVVLIGQDADLIKAVIPLEVAAFEAADMSDAVKVAQQTARAEDIVLLSPACASFDMFSNYMERGEAFARAVKDATV